MPGLRLLFFWLYNLIGIVRDEAKINVGGDANGMCIWSKSSKVCSLILNSHSNQIIIASKSNSWH